MINALNDPLMLSLNDIWIVKTPEGEVTEYDQFRRRIKKVPSEYRTRRS